LGHWGVGAFNLQYSISPMPHFPISWIDIK
jgi:hypothetical protein